MSIYCTLPLTNLLISSRRRASPTPSKGVRKCRKNATPSKGVRRDYKGKTALQRIWRLHGNFTPSKGVEKCGKIRLLRKECRVDFRRKWLLERFLVTEGAFLLIVILSNLQLLGFEETFLFLPPQNLVQIFGLKEHTEKDTHKPAQRYFVGQDALLLTILLSNTCISAPLP